LISKLSSFSFLCPVIRAGLHPDSHRDRRQRNKPAVYYFTIPVTGLQFFLVYQMVFHSLRRIAFLLFDLKIFQRLPDDLKKIFSMKILQAIGTTPPEFTINHEVNGSTFQFNN